MESIRALVLRAPGINCDRETVRACRLVGFVSDLVHINQLLQAPTKLLDYDFLVIPGGFSYGDDLGAGTLLAKNLTIHLGAQLRQFVDEGRPLLGICNGFQVLVRAGLLPGNVEQHVATLTDNASAQFECRWITLAVQPSTCIFTQSIERSIELPVAHGEGQFVLCGDITQLQALGQIPLLYSGGSGQKTVAYPDNPNGSVGNVAGVCNARGNVLGLMPHPERYVSALQHPQRRGIGRGPIDRAQGEGLLIFKNAYAYAQSLRGFPHSPHPKGTINRAPIEGVQGITPSPMQISYADSGVNIASADRAKRLMHDAVRATHGPEVLAGMGAFAGVFNATTLQKMRCPALVSSTDGVGTKTLIAAQARRFDTIGYDLVNHCVNDLLTQGARPLFFMDYLAMGELVPQQAAAVVRSIAGACQQVGCALLGGETAEMPSVYLPGAFDLAGTIVGVVEQDEIINGSTIRIGDILLGLPSSGLHTNGYSLVRHLFGLHESDQSRLNSVFPELGEPLVDALLRPHRCYLGEINLLRERLVERGKGIKGIAHITGGGFEGNLSRILPANMQAVIQTDGWSVPPLFTLLARLGHLTHEELYRTFNMGVGMVIVLSPREALAACGVLPELLTVGYITQGEGVVFASKNSGKGIS
ncbi:MAG: phosphoribosylformylglycinamidine cyclo-ligase [Ktedonobacteraceae bacterium]|nr:phosphoribosylformylglycinamidine cyclo-ligase [Ktedonobacteraceae bacterium]